jgi:tetratricopeptide (TPR) repeat protein
VKTALTVLITVMTFTAAWAGIKTPKDLEDIEKSRRAAIELFNQGEYEKALPLLEKILETDPNDKTARRYMLIFNRQVLEPYCKQAADAYLSGDYPEAISAWEEILKINPDDKRVAGLIEDAIAVSDDHTVQSLYAGADKLLKEGKLELATAELEKILAVHPADKRASEMLTSTRNVINNSAIKDLYEKADSYAGQKEYGLAIEEWKKVLAIDPSQEMASRMIASVQRTKLDEMYSKARGLYKEGNYIASRDTYNNILAENPTDQQTRNMVARLNDTIKVVPQLTEAGKAWDILRTGLFHHISSDGNPEVTVAASWYAAQLEPENTLVLAMRDFVERKHISAIRTMETPVKDMNIVEQYLFASLNHIYEGRYDLSIRECNLILELEPDNVLAMKRLGSAYFAMGKRSKARQAWQKALELAPEDTELKDFIRQAR